MPEAFGRFAPTLSGPPFPYEVVAIGVVYALKGGSFSAFYRWLSGDWSGLFSGPLPERTRLARLLVRHEEAARTFLARPRGELVCDSYGVEMVHPWRAERGRRKEARQRRRKKRVYKVKTLARKGLSNRRWIVGAKLGIVIRPDGRIVEFDWAAANEHDNVFNFLAARHPKTPVLADRGYVQKEGQPKNLTICSKGERSDRMIVETTFGMLTQVCHTKHLYQRSRQHITAHFTYLAAMFNTVIRWTRGKLTLARFSL